MYCVLEVEDENDSDYIEVENVEVWGKNSKNSNLKGRCEREKELERRK